MKTYHLIKFIVILLISPVIVCAQSQHTLSNPKATKEAIALYTYINDVFGKKTLSGQMFSGWGFDEFKYIHELTGKYPAIKGLDFIHARESDSVVNAAIQWWKEGGIPTIM
jgi:hypothetical protein